MHARLRSPGRGALRIGRLSEGAAVLAQRVHDQLAKGDRTVFAADDGVVYVDQPERTDGIPLHWIAGTFTLGQSYPDLVEDIAFLSNSRSKDWIIG
ncbi:hypothetical protein FHW12_001052 [Dokdonella fugitiva]|jgi:hypothetical protein|uniref:Uncharacterized protein n=1 Tax=Dokdonella fugitiva TaxID=328517 RepID=A0A839F3T1_9GAMM|nr:hypothetical protein [Dokdonella fugitiva]MBA8886861.1 hypothetical protein [Dokdonella fugitiva]